MNNEIAKKENRSQPTSIHHRGDSLAAYFRRLIPINAKASARMNITHAEAEIIIMQGFTAAAAGFGSKEAHQLVDPERKTYWLIGFGQFQKKHSLTQKES